MKSTKTLLALFCAAALFSCKKDLAGSGHVITQQRQAGNFTAVTCKGDFLIVLKKAAATAIDVTGEDNVLEKTVTEISNGILTVRYADGIKTHKNKQVTVNVSLPAFSSVQLEGSGNIKSEEHWSIPHLTTNINGSGYITLYAEGETFDGEVNGSGKLFMLFSKFQASSIHVNGSGNVNANLFTTDTADIRIDGSGGCSINVNTKLKAKINGSGTIYYKGNPDTNITVAGSGKVVKSS